MQTNRTIIGVDTAKWVLSKWVFHLYWVEVDTGEDMNVPLSRVKFLRHFANRVPCLVVIDAIEANTGPGNCRDSVTRSGFCRSKWFVPSVSGVSTPPGFQREIGVKAQGSSRSMSEAGWPAAMASSVALR